MTENQGVRVLETASTAPGIVYRVGFWSAVSTAVWTIAFDLSAAAGAAGVQLPAWIVLASAFLIVPSFLVLMVSIHFITPEGKKIWSQLGLSFAIIYAVLVGLNYFLQLTVVREYPQVYSWLSMDVRADSAFWALEVLGYSFMSLAALCLAPVFTGGKIENAIRWLFILNAVFNGLGDIVYLMTVNPIHPLVIASLGIWGIAFPAACVLLAVVFNRS